MIERCSTSIFQFNFFGNRSLNPSILTFAHGGALVLLEGVPLAVGAAPLGAGLAAEALAALEAGPAPPGQGSAALGPRRPRRPAAGHWEGRKQREGKFKFRVTERGEQSQFIPRN